MMEIRSGSRWLFYKERDKIRVCYNVDVSSERSFCWMFFDVVHEWATKWMVSKFARRSFSPCDWLDEGRQNKMSPQSVFFRSTDLITDVVVRVFPSIFAFRSWKDFFEHNKKKKTRAGASSYLSSMMNDSSLTKNSTTSSSTFLVSESNASVSMSERKTDFLGHCFFFFFFNFSDESIALVFMIKTFCHFFYSSFVHRFTGTL